MKIKEKTSTIRCSFRCYVFQIGDVWFAGCITLNLTAIGNTEKEVEKNIDNLICDYLDVVTKNRYFEEYKHLLSRPAPLYMYWDYFFHGYWRIFINSICKLIKRFTLINYT